MPTRKGTKQKEKKDTVSLACQWQMALDEHKRWMHHACACVLSSDNIQ
jgi:hypothetical protein